LTTHPPPRVADAVYTQLTAHGYPDSTNTAAALHHAITALRAEFPDDPLIWAPYIHLGP
jgi:hypothetical protein